MNLGGAANGLGRGKTALGVNEVGCEDGVDQGGFAQASLSCEVELQLASCTEAEVQWIWRWHTNTDDVELETSLQELLLNLRGDAVETDMVLGKHRLRLLCLSGGCHCVLKYETKVEYQESVLVKEF